MLADITLKGLGIRDYFENIFGGDDENCLKPSACVLEPIFSELHIDISNTLMVGDMAIDVETGKNAGAKTCWVTYGLGKAEDMKDLKPDYVIDDIMELKDIVKEGGYGQEHYDLQHAYMPVLHKGEAVFKRERGEL